MSGLEQVRRASETPPPEPVLPPSSGGLGVRKQALDRDLDAVLDRIDGVLEGNAEQFVKGFIQKGGQ